MRLLQWYLLSLPPPRYNSWIAGIASCTMGNILLSHFQHTSCYFLLAKWKCLFLALNRKQRNYRGRRTRPWPRPSPTGGGREPVTGEQDCNELYSCIAKQRRLSDVPWINRDRVPNCHSSPSQGVLYNNACLLGILYRKEDFVFTTGCNCFGHYGKFWCRMNE